MAEQADASNAQTLFKNKTEEKETKDCLQRMCILLQAVTTVPSCR